MERHNAVVEAIAKDVKSFYDKRQPWRVYHGGNNSTRHSTRTAKEVINTGPLSNVLEVDVKERTALVEPNVSMAALTRSTLACGLLPAVVMEFPEITVGGGFSGNSGESSSWKYGLFDSIVLSIEMILANGDVLQASPTQNADLFLAAGGGHGVLGIVSMLKIKLIEAADFVEVTCHSVEDIGNTVEKMESLIKSKEYTYIDGMMFGKDRGVIMSGLLTNDVAANVTIKRFVRGSDQWFYRFVEKNIKSRGEFKFVCPVYDYLFRWDRGVFWGGKYAFSYFLAPFNRVTRFCLDRFLRAEIMFRALHASGLARTTFIQDIGVPIQDLDGFIAFIHERLRLDYYWLCPIAPRSATDCVSFAHVFNDLSDGPWVNVGIWGVGPKDVQDFVQLNRDIEAETHRLHGLKALYARTYYTADEFWQVYDKSRHDEIRAKYFADYLPTLYDKVREPDLSSDGRRLVSCDNNRKITALRSTRPLPGVKGFLSVLKQAVLPSSPAKM